MSAADKVLLIDGPMAGQVIQHDPNGPVVYDKGSETAASDLGLYAVHKWVLMGRMILIGSCEPGVPSDRAMADAFWTWLASDEAQIISITPTRRP